MCISALISALMCQMITCTCARMNARTHACTHARTHARMHARTRTGPPAFHLSTRSAPTRQRTRTHAPTHPLTHTRTHVLTHVARTRAHPLTRTHPCARTHARAFKFAHTYACMVVCTQCVRRITTYDAISIQNGERSARPGTKLQNRSLHNLHARQERESKGPLCVEPRSLIGPGLHCAPVPFAHRGSAAPTSDWPPESEVDVGRCGSMWDHLARVPLRRVGRAVGDAGRWAKCSGCEG